MFVNFMTGEGAWLTRLHREGVGEGPDCTGERIGEGNDQGRGG